MGKVTGFLEFQRLEENAPRARAAEKALPRVHPPPHRRGGESPGRACMDCGTPFCMSGCPVNNIIPDFNDLVYKQDCSTPSRHCIPPTIFPNSPAYLSGSVRGKRACCASTTTVGIKSIEHAIIDKAFEEGWVKPQPPEHKTARRSRVVAFRSGWARVRPAARDAPGTTSRVRKKRPDRRSSALRNTRFQDGEVADRPPAIK